MVDASVPGPSQLRHVDDQRLGRGVDGSATAVAMCQSRRAAFTVGRQDAAGVAGSYSHQLGGLVQGHVLCCQAVENLKSALFFWGQCHILHDVTAMMGPGHLDQGLTLDVDGTNAFKMMSARSEMAQTVPTASVSSDLIGAWLQAPIAVLSAHLAGVPTAASSPRR